MNTDTNTPRAPMGFPAEQFLDVSPAPGEYIVVELTYNTVTVEVCQTWIVADQDNCIDRLCGHVDTLSVLY